MTREQALTMIVEYIKAEKRARLPQRKLAYQNEIKKLYAIIHPPKK